MGRRRKKSEPTNAEAVRNLRAMLDRETPGWREAVRGMFEDGHHPGATFLLRIGMRDGSVREIPFLMNPEAVPDDGDGPHPDAGAA